MNNRVPFALGVLFVVLLSLGPHQAAAAAPVLRLSGSFFQYWDEMQNWPPENWQAVLDSMKAVKMNTVIVQMLMRENNDGTLHSFIGASGQVDATEAILTYADTNDFRVFLGLYLPNWNHDMLASDFLSETQTRMAMAAQEAWNRYLSGNRHRSFSGWYVPYEPWTAAYQPAEIQRLRAFFQAIDTSCQAISGDWPLMISPFINGYRAPPCAVELAYGQILNQSGIDIVLLQDSVGAQQWRSNILQRVEPYARAFQNACNATGVRLWANLESFQISGSVYGPCDAARLGRQLEASAPFVEDFVTFDFLHYMNPEIFLNSWDTTRRAAMQQLYTDYKRAFADTDYAPFAPPTLSALVEARTCTLSWQGTAGDQYQVHFKTNISDASWLPLDVTIQANDGAFSAVDLWPAGAGLRFYRVQKLARLQPPENMVHVTPGTFQMGTPSTDPNKTANELPQFPARLSREFWIGRYEVTQSEYQNVACTNPATFTGDLERPVESVTWNNAINYCALLTQRERQALRLPDDYVYRLPTEAEWEYAARGGTTNWFSFGDDPLLLTNYAWFSANSKSTTHLVGQQQSNPWSLYDVHGNVFEWCWDWIESTPVEPVVDYLGSTNGPYRAIRGGAWSYPAAYCRSSWRVGYPPALRTREVGFRIVLAPVVQ